MSPFAAAAVGGISMATNELMLLAICVAALLAIHCEGSTPPELSICCSLHSSVIFEDCGNAACCSCQNPESFFFNVPEELSVGTEIMSIQATDSDSSAVTMSLTGDNAATDYFSLQTNGSAKRAVLVVRRRLDLDTQPKNFIYPNLFITLTDDTPNSRDKKFNLLQIVNINDNSPEFLQLPYRWATSENTMADPVFTVRVIDRDRGNFDSSVTISFEEITDANNAFSYSSQSFNRTSQIYSRNITLTRPLNYESGSFMQISMKATDSGGLIAQTYLIVNVIDQQDTPPFFDTLPYFARVAENTPSNTNLLTVSAKDGDRGKPHAVQYQLVGPANLLRYFRMNSSSGQLTTSDIALDREQSDIAAALGVLELTVMAKEVSSMTQAANISQATAAIRITVQDVNDLRPSFSASSYRAQLFENTQNGVPLTFDTVPTISDADSGVNSEFNLSLTTLDGRVFSDFDVTPTMASREANVVVRVRNSSAVDFELVQTVQFLIVATETRTAERYSSTATVTVNITNANDNRPVFNQSQYTFSLRENSPIGTFVGAVLAADADSGLYGVITYSIDGTDALKFRINSSSGEIFVNIDAAMNTTALDRERAATIFLTALATDGGGFVIVAQLQLQLTDANDNAPQFTRPSYSAVVRENSLLFETPVVVSAIDNDERGSNNSAINYAIVSGDINDNFDVNADSGELSIKRQLDAESLNSTTIMLTIRAADRGSPSLSSFTNVTVTVMDVNDNAPTCTQPLLQASLKENATAGTGVVKLSAIDADSAGSDNSKIFFRIGSGAADKFSINGETGQLAVERGADLDINRYGSEYNLTVEVYDRGSPQLSGTCLVRISIVDVNDQRPYFAQISRQVRVSESMPVGAAIHFNATDPDSSARLQYSLLLAEMAATDENGRPLQAAEYNLTDLFLVSSSNGTVFLKKPLDRERAEEIKLPIQVVDLAAETVLPAQTATGTLVVTVDDVNDEPPYFPAPAENGTFRISVSESVLPPAEIGFKAEARDSDKVTGPLQLQYSIVQPEDFFSIDSLTAQVSLKAPLDRETSEGHTFLVVANDSLHTTTATVLVAVVDGNDVVPTFYQFNDVSVLENEAVGKLLTVVKANDSDAGAFGQVRYSIISGDEKSTFALDAVSGELTIAQPLDREALPSTSSGYSLNIEAADNPNGTGAVQRVRAVLNVTVLDVNDNAPVFAQGNYTVSSLLENVGSGQQVREIEATDRDAGINRQIWFQLGAIAGKSNRSLELFQVATRAAGDLFHATITTRRSLTGEVGWYDMHLLAVDSGSPQLTGSTKVTIFVADVNDHAPRFVRPSQAQTFFRVNESTNASSTVGMQLLHALATDEDFDNNGLVRYELVFTGTDPLPFSIDSVSGVVSINGSLDRETKVQHSFQIKAFDQGTPSLSSLVNIVVEVWDVDESPPVFAAAARVQSFSVEENLPPNQIIPGLNISGRRLGVLAAATDPDASASTAAVCYFVINRMYETFFLNKSTAELFSIRTIDREATAQFELHVLAVSETFCSTTAYEWQSAPLKQRFLDTDPVTYSADNAAMAKVLVSVADQNDNAPIWREQQHFGGVTVDNTPGTNVYNFADYVTDPDTGNNSQLIFNMSAVTAEPESLRQQMQERSILSSVFSLNSRTGLLRTGSATYFQESMSGSLSFNVSAADGRYSVSASAKIYVLSLDQQIVVTLSESTANATAKRDSLVEYLSNITGWQMVVNRIVTHRRDDGSADSGKSDMYMHAIIPSDNTVVPAAQVRDKIDLLWAEMRVLYNRYAVLWVRLANQPAAADSTVEILKIALIAVACGLTILLFFSCLSLWSCRRMYRRKLKAATAVAFGPSSNGTHKTPGTNMHTFEGSNPIWMDLHGGQRQDYDNPDCHTDEDSETGTQPSSFQLKRYDEMEKALNFDEEGEGVGESTTDDPTLKRGSSVLSAAVDAAPRSLPPLQHRPRFVPPPALPRLPASDI